MKKLMTLMLGLALTFGSVAVFAQGGKDDTNTAGKKKGGKKKGGKKTDSTDKK